MTEHPMRSWFYLFACNFMWSLQFTCVKLVQDQVGPLFTVWGPMTLSMFLLIPFVRREGPEESSGPRPRLAFTYILLAAVGVFPAQVFMTWGTRLSTASNAAVIALMLPVTTALFAVVFLRERMTPVRWISFAVAIPGVLLCSANDLRGLSLRGPYFWGNLLILGATLGSSFYNSYGKKALKWHSPMRMLFWTYVAECSLMAPVVLYEERSVFMRIPSFTARTWIGMALLTFFHNYLSMVLFLKALKKLDAIQASLSNYLITFFGIPIAAIWLGERLSPAALAGGVLVLASTLLITVWEEIGLRRLRTAGTLFLLALLLPVRGLAAQAVDPAKGLALSNEHARFQFEPGGMGLAAMVDRHSGVNHIGPVRDKHLLWEVAFAKGTQIQRINNNYKPCTRAYLEDRAGGVRRAVIEWNELRWWLEDRVVTVRVTVDLPPDSGIAQWSISVQNRSDYWGLWTVTYPLVSGFPASGQYDIARPTFGSGGHLLHRWTERIEGRHPSGGWPMQFLSLQQGSSAVYFASQDPDARAKDFVVEPGSRICLVHYVENMGVAGSDDREDYPVAFGVYQGGWLEAAQRYRPWALQQKWCRAGRISTRSDMPDLIKNVGLWVRGDWVWNQAEGSLQEMNAPLVEAQKKLGVPMALHWYNWHHMRFDNLYPHFLPAKPGFRERVKDLVDRGFLVMPYINGSSADMNIPDFARFAPHAITDEAGGFRMHFYSDAAGRLLSMCPAQEFWRNTIATLADNLFAGEGVNGLYVDQISAMSHELCFNRSHGHPLGGGRYWADGNRELLRMVRNAAHRNGRRCVVTSEGADEVFFDLLDANLTWAEATDWEIPLMEVVYSGYTLFFGSPVDYTKSDRLFNFAQGQAFLDGRQNGWIDLGVFKPEHAEKAAYFRQCGRYRVVARKFLTYGRLLRPIEPSRPVPTFTEDGFGWRTKHRGTVPSAEGRLWQSEDGHLGIFLANYVNEPVSFSYELDPARFGLKWTRFRLTEITPEGSQAIGTVSAPLRRTEELGPRKIRVIELAPL